VAVPGCWRRLLELWLAGQTPSMILADPEGAAEKLSADNLNRWVDDVFAYRLPWGLNSLGNYLKQYAEETDQPWPAVCDYYSSFVKYGVHDTVVCWVLAFGIPSRGVATRIAASLDGRAENPAQLAQWLQAGGIDQLAREGLSDSDAEMLRAAVLRGGHRRGRNGRHSLTLKLRHATLSGPVPTPGTRVLIESVTVNAEGHWYRLRGLGGAIHCQFRTTSDRFASLMATPEFVTAMVVQPERQDSNTILYIQMESI
jgi:hypothetical protein